MNTKEFYQAFIKPVGVTDEVTACDCCGKSKLKRTVVFSFDENANDDHTPLVYGFRFLGTTCALNIDRYAYGNQNMIKKVKANKMKLEQLMPAIELSESEKKEARIIELTGYKVKIDEYFSTPKTSFEMRSNKYENMEEGRRWIEKELKELTTA